MIEDLEKKKKEIREYEQLLEEKEREEIRIEKLEQDKAAIEQHPDFPGWEAVRKAGTC